MHCINGEWLGIITNIITVIAAVFTAAQRLLRAVRKDVIGLANRLDETNNRLDKTNNRLDETIKHFEETTKENNRHLEESNRDTNKRLDQVYHIILEEIRRRS